MDTATIDTTTINETVRDAAHALILTGALMLAPALVAQAAADHSTKSTLSTHAKEFGETVKHDTRVVGAACKEGAHRIAVGAKAVAHEIATAAKRGAAETRAAVRGDRVDTPAR